MYRLNSVVYNTIIAKLIVDEMDCLREETVLMPGCSAAQCSVAQTGRQQFKEEVAWL